MAPPEALQDGAVDVLGLVGEAVMVPVEGRPPEGALLAGGLGQQGQQELRKPPQAEAPVPEIAMVAGGDPEHPDAV